MPIDAKTQKRIYKAVSHALTDDFWETADEIASRTGLSKHYNQLVLRTVTISTLNDLMLRGEVERRPFATTYEYHKVQHS